MPTNFASKATASRIRSASAASVSSASGSAMGIVPRRFVEPRLQDELRRDLVARGLASGRPDARGRERRLGVLCCVPLIHARDLQGEAAFEPAREALGAR